ncbi:MAG: hypothetical protein PHP94_04670 [Eubacteriales bacterium]|nr:hypothetical protein [Eubacteriales bacterium]
MSQTTELILRIIGLIIAAVGLAVVYLAPRIVDRKHLDVGRQVDPKVAEHLTPEELANYRRDGAILDIKLKGLLLAAPGFVLILIAFA